MEVVGIYTCRNAYTAGYPFVEAIESVVPVVDEFLINDGGSEDGTFETLQELSEMHNCITLLQIDDIESERWETIDYHLNKMMEMRPDADWFFESQADEKLEHPQEMRQCISHAHKNGYNGIRQRRLTKYPDEVQDDSGYDIIRAVRNVDGLTSYEGGDSFHVGRHASPRDGYTSHNMPPEYDSVVPVYHLRGIRTEDEKEEYYRRHAEHLAPEGGSRRETYLDKYGE